MNAGQLARRWLLACLVAALLVNFFGGYSMVVTAVFIVICLTGLPLIAQDSPSQEAVAVTPMPGAVDVVAPPKAVEVVAPPKAVEVVAPPKAVDVVAPPKAVDVVAAAGDLSDDDGEPYPDDEIETTTLVITEEAAPSSDMIVIYEDAVAVPNSLPAG